MFEDKQSSRLAEKNLGIRSGNQSINNLTKQIEIDINHHHCVINKLNANLEIIVI